jgi:two-component sensor histidine kinase
MKAYVNRSQELKSLFDTNSVGYELLHSEIHRRVKNSLNTISSILGLQINALNMVTEKNTKEILENSKQRIETIAINHEALYQNHNMGEVSFNVYAQNLIDMINQAHNRNILVQIESFDISLPADTMFLMGIILSELFTNSIKHAFEKDKDGDRVKISLSKHENHFLFSYHERGNENIDIEKILNNQTLGMRLVKLTVKQLDGFLEVTQNNGLIFTIDFLRDS